MNERVGPLLKPSEAVIKAREFLKPEVGGDPSVIIEVEVDSLDGLQDALTVRPDIVLLDNMPPELLRQAVAMRDRAAPGVELEASGGINLKTLRDVALTGIDRISLGALTHSATNLDLGLDWRLGSQTAKRYREAQPQIAKSVIIRGLCWAVQPTRRIC